ncbi:MAG: MraY family glycosyltransferase [Candidatus Baldrarchaeia archaeon]
MNISESSLLITVMGFLSSLLATALVMPPLVLKLKRMGVMGVDVHKLNRPEIPEMGGLGIIVGLAASSVIVMLLDNNSVPQISAFLLSSLIAGLIGAIDDLRPLNAKVKPILTAFAGIPVLLLGVYNPRPSVPIIGQMRLTIIYPILIPMAYAVMANAVNMLDVFNGAMPGSCIVALAALIVVSLLLRSKHGLILSAILLGSLIAYWRYNKYPARVFAGDVGSLSVGAAIASIAIIGRMEFVTVVAFLPHITNGFIILVSIGGFLERRQIKIRPTFLRPDQRLAANPDPRAPLTFVGLILASEPLYEYEVVKALIIITGFCGLLAIVSALLIILS